MTTATPTSESPPVAAPADIGGDAALSQLHLPGLSSGSSNNTEFTNRQNVRVSPEPARGKPHQSSASSAPTLAGPSAPMPLTSNDPNASQTLGGSCGEQRTSPVVMTIENSKPESENCSPIAEGGSIHSQLMDTSLQSKRLKAWSTIEKTLTEHDKREIEGYKEDIDSLLTFAGLYSGVLTAFVTVSFTQLQEDVAAESLRVLRRIASQTSSAAVLGEHLAESVTMPMVSQSSSFQPSTTAIRVNILWFASLVISLSTASFSILVKQWLREYMAVATSSPQGQLRIRHFRRSGLDSWKVLAIASVLPLFLQLSLGLFFIGLCFFTSDIHPTIGKTTLTLICAWAFLFIAFTFSPISSAKCPYKTPALGGLTAWWRRYWLTVCGAISISIIGIGAGIIVIVLGTILYPVLLAISVPPLFILRMILLIFTLVEVLRSRSPDSRISIMDRQISTGSFEPDAISLRKADVAETPESPSRMHVQESVSEDQPKEEKEVMKDKTQDLLILSSADAIQANPELDVYIFNDALTETDVHWSIVVEFLADIIRNRIPSVPDFPSGPGGVTLDFKSLPPSAMNAIKHIFTSHIVPKLPTKSSAVTSYGTAGAWVIAIFFSAYEYETRAETSELKVPNFLKFMRAWLHDRPNSNHQSSVAHTNEPPFLLWLCSYLSQVGNIHTLEAVEPEALNPEATNLENTVPRAVESGDAIPEAARSGSAEPENVDLKAVKEEDAELLRLAIAASVRHAPYRLISQDLPWGQERNTLRALTIGTANYLLDGVEHATYTVEEKLRMVVLALKLFSAMHTMGLRFDDASVGENSVPVPPSVMQRIRNFVKSTNNEDTIRELVTEWTELPVAFVIATVEMFGPGSGQDTRRDSEEHCITLLERVVGTIAQRATHWQRPRLSSSAEISRFNFKSPRIRIMNIVKLGFLAFSLVQKHRRWLTQHSISSGSSVTAENPSTVPQESTLAPSPDNTESAWPQTFVFLASVLRAAKRSNLALEFLNSSYVDEEYITFEVSQSLWQELGAMERAHFAEIQGLKGYCSELSTIYSLAQALEQDSKLKLKLDEADDNKWSCYRWIRWLLSISPYIIRVILINLL